MKEKAGVLEDAQRGSELVGVMCVLEYEGALNK